MALPRFFILPDQKRSGLITLTGNDVRHLQRVLRLQSGDKVECLDGRGHVYLVKLNHVEHDIAIGEIEDSYKVDSEPELQVTIAQGLPKGERWDFVLQKCSELGATVFQPLFTQRTIVKLQEEQIPRRLERWQKIASEAAEQSRRSIAPRVLAPLTLSQWLEKSKEFDLVLVAWENEDKLSLKGALAALPDLKRLAILVGPEGGFADSEIEEAISAGCLAVSIGPRVLRSETASIAMLAMTLYHYGDMGDR
ncbi:MAG: 16S rRNA (uracil(1498)-N(3))-methyltransferase [Symbiobacteriaceae bacterium]|nr:16S rRNA (uracil(1498)-N(3))-methyltransferase [Symbiobacteriaceae bacterium]